MTTDTILVTGAAGLLGNAVRVMLERAGRDVTAIDRVSETEEGRAIIRCDVTDVHRLHAIVRKKRLLGVIHCGALSGPMVGRDDPSAMVAINVVGTANVLELARIHEAARFVYCSSVSACGEVIGDLVQEDVPLHPSTLYGASKVCGEQIVAAYQKQYGIDGTSLRYATIYGPRRTTSCVLRDMITGAIAGSPVRIPFGKDFYLQMLHVDDAARATIAAFDHPHPARSAYNVTGGSYLSIPQIADVVRSVFPTADISIDEGDDPFGDRQGRFDISAIRDDLGFSPGVALVDGIRDYADWLRLRSGGK
jgi:nucleoside-diphosphate-sugar epimerase